MKRIFLLFVLAGFIASCEQDDSNNISQTAFLFSTTTSDLPVSNALESFVEFEIGVTTKSSSDRTVTLVVNPESTATSDQYTIEPSTVVIPAGAYSTKVKVVGNYDNIPESGSVKLVFNLGGDVDVMSGKENHEINLYRFCLSDLAGTYSVTTNYGFHDFLPNFSSNTTTTTITALAAENTYSVPDFSGGLYSVGPYASAYGTGNVDNSLTFVVNCDNVSWTGQSDPWGAIVPAAGGVNSYNATTGVITISWFCQGYGENGVSVYTPL